MIPWPFIWWVATSHLEPAPVTRPHTRHGPPAERAQLNDIEADAFSNLQATFWQGRSGRWRRLREHILTLRCYVMTSSVVLTAVLLGVATIIAAGFNRLWAIPGVIVLDGWLVVMVRRRRQPRVVNRPS